MKKILIIGGDRRQVELCNMLKQKGHSVYLIGFEKLGLKNEQIKNPDYIFLPVPCLLPDGYLKAPYAHNPIGLKEIVAQYPKSKYLLGECDETVKEVFGKQVQYIDLLQDEAFLVRNALLTAQAAVCAYLKQSLVALCDMHCVVIGYGRIGRLLSRLISAHGAKVTATARRAADLEFIKAEGYNALHTSKVQDIIPDADIIWNTVPAHVVCAQSLESLRPSAQYIELASPPYGTDIETAKKTAACVYLEQGLPGRYFPVSAAVAMLRVFEREAPDGK